jgi:hypothetical protein
MKRMVCLREAYGMPEWRVWDQWMIVWAHYKGGKPKKKLTPSDFNSDARMGCYRSSLNSFSLLFWSWHWWPTDRACSSRKLDVQFLMYKDCWKWSSAFVLRVSTQHKHCTTLTLMECVCVEVNMCWGKQGIQTTKALPLMLMEVSLNCVCQHRVNAAQTPSLDLMMHLSLCCAFQ